MTLYIDKFFLEADQSIPDGISNLITFFNRKETPQDVIKKVSEYVIKINYINGNTIYEKNSIINKIFKLGLEFYNVEFSFRDFLIPLVPLCYSKIRNDPRNQEYIRKNKLHIFHKKNPLHKYFKVMSEQVYNERAELMKQCNSDPLEWNPCVTSLISLKQIINAQIERRIYLHKFEELNKISVKKIKKEVTSEYKSELAYIPDKDITPLIPDLSDIILAYLYDPAQIMSFVLQHFSKSINENELFTCSHFDYICIYNPIKKIMDIISMLNSSSKFLPQLYHTLCKNHKLLLSDITNEIIYENKKQIILCGFLKDETHRCELNKKYITVGDLIKFIDNARCDHLNSVAHCRYKYTFMTYYKCPIFCVQTIIYNENETIIKFGELN